MTGIQQKHRQGYLLQSIVHVTRLYTLSIVKLAPHMVQCCDSAEQNLTIKITLKGLGFSDRN